MSTTIDQITTYDPLTSYDKSRTASSDLDPQAFMKLLVAQLKYQDPLKGTDSTQFMQQVSTLSSMQQQYNLNDQMGKLMTQQSIQSSVSMIGHTVSALVDDTTVEGTVSSVTLSSDGAVLNVNGTQVPYDSVTKVT